MNTDQPSHRLALVELVRKLHEAIIRRCERLPGWLGRPLTVAWCAFVLLLYFFYIVLGLAAFFGLLWLLQHIIK